MWEYEALFQNQVTGPQDQVSWFEVATSMSVGRMAYLTKTIKSGPMLELQIYPVFGIADRTRLRAAKRALTRENQQRANDERAKRRFVRLANCNFGRGDLFVTLTYEHAPSYERAQKDMRNFLERVKRLRNRRGLEELRYLYVIEDMEDGVEKRIHIHLMTNGGLTAEELERCWQKGRTNVAAISPDKMGLEGLARYFVKSNKNRRKWAGSHNLRKPKESISRHKLSNRKVRELAMGAEVAAKEALERCWPGYSYADCNVYYSDTTDGVYIYAKMRKEEEGP